MKIAGSFEREREEGVGERKLQNWETQKAPVFYNFIHLATHQDSLHCLVCIILIAQH